MSGKYAFSLLCQFFIVTRNPRFFICGLFAFLAGTDLKQGKIPIELIDHRYFYIDRKNTARCVCGFARAHATILIRGTKPSLFLDPTWLHSIMSSRGNPGVIGSVVEQSCLTALADMGLHHAGAHWDAITPNVFGVNLLNKLPTCSESCRKFFIPDDPFFKDIDALHFEMNVARKTVHVMPIQITVSKKSKHKDSEAAFYSRCSWKAKFPGFELSSTFVWIVEDEVNWEHVQAVHRNLRSG
jgi:hypothetical protein